MHFWALSSRKLPIFEFPKLKQTCKENTSLFFPTITNWDGNSSKWWIFFVCFVCYVSQDEPHTKSWTHPAMAATPPWLTPWPTRDNLYKNPFRFTSFRFRCEDFLLRYGWFHRMFISSIYYQDWNKLRIYTPFAWVVMDLAGNKKTSPLAELFTTGSQSRLMFWKKNAGIGWRNFLSNWSPFFESTFLHIIFSYNHSSIM